MKWTIGIVVVLCLASCSNDDGDPPNPLLDLQGRWERLCPNGNSHVEMQYNADGTHQYFFNPFGDACSLPDSIDMGDAGIGLSGEYSYAGEGTSASGLDVNIIKRTYLVNDLEDADTITELFTSALFTSIGFQDEENYIAYYIDGDSLYFSDASEEKDNVEWILDFDRGYLKQSSE